MTDAQLAVLGSLIGVLVGVIGTLAATGIQQRSENKRAQLRFKDDRRKEHTELVAALSAADIKTWEWLVSLKRINETLARQEPGPQVDALTSQRTERMVAINAATSDLADRSAMVRILVPELADVVAELWEVYGKFPFDDDFDEHEAAYRTARRAFEKQAQKLLSA
ncbi:hypothetical protein J2W14_002365 [Pseudarthrobacter oxydans]|uniref:hypothetical protein n=1 Tax=Pseudarthrobacter oxydans TaxID=1671 RepID=UPI00278772C8|nr:hypothetical protein [Pseudarthrobacter oxydans]MDP9982963.1 hypothetical protein [Pseudarthrobacter oxydans]